MRRRFTLPLLLLGLLTLPVAADPDPNILYTTRKEFVRVSPPHPLTLNAHIDKFAYDPLGLEVACTGEETQAGQTTYFVKTLDARTGKELHRLTMTVPQYTEARFNLLGWTPSGKYLLLERTQPKDDGTNDSITDLVRWDLSADPPKLRVIDPAGNFSGEVVSGVENPRISPDDHWLLFRLHYRTPTAEGKPGPLQWTELIYDAEQDTYRSLPLPSGEYAASWTDNSHLLVLSHSQDDKQQQQMDVITGKISSLKDQPGAEDPALCKQFPDLSLTVDYKTQVDSTQSGAMASTLLWVRCNLRQHRPLSTVGAGITMGNDNPQAVWSPTGRQIAYLNHGDLYVSDVALVPSDGLAHEKMALGLPLTCREERAIAASDLKQIGLGIMQYTQDYDETFPPAEGVDEALLPYIKDRHVFGIGTVHWNYHTPDNLSMAAMDAPADYVMGTMDLPCGQIILYGDGHVKEMAKE